MKWISKLENLQNFVIVAIEEKKQIELFALQQTFHTNSARL